MLACFRDWEQLHWCYRFAIGRGSRIRSKVGVVDCSRATDVPPTSRQQPHPPLPSGVNSCAPLRLDAREIKCPQRMAEVRSLAGQHHYSERLVRYNQTSATMNSTPGSHRQTVLISVANSTTASEWFNLQGDLHYLYLMFTSHRSRIRLLGPLGPLRVYHFQVSSSPSPTSGQCYPQRSKLKAGTSPPARLCQPLLSPVRCLSAHLQGIGQATHHLHPRGRPSPLRPTAGRFCR